MGRRVYLKAYHYALLGGFLGTIGAQIALLDQSWGPVKTPKFVGTVVVHAGLFVAALFSPRPRNPYRTDRETDLPTYQPPSPKSMTPPKATPRSPSSRFLT